MQARAALAAMRGYGDAEHFVRVLAEARTLDGIEPELLAALVSALAQRRRDARVRSALARVTHAVVREGWRVHRDGDGDDGDGGDGEGDGEGESADDGDRVGDRDDTQRALAPRDDAALLIAHALSRIPDAPHCARACGRLLAEVRGMSQLDAHHGSVRALAMLEVASTFADEPRCRAACDLVARWLAMHAPHCPPDRVAALCGRLAERTSPDARRAIVNVAAMLVLRERATPGAWLDGLDDIALAALARALRAHAAWRQCRGAAEAIARALSEARVCVSRPIARDTLARAMSAWPESAVCRVALRRLDAR